MPSTQFSTTLKCTAHHNQQANCHVHAVLLLVLLPEGVPVAHG